MAGRDRAQSGAAAAGLDALSLATLRDGERVVVRVATPEVLFNEMLREPGRLAAGVLHSDGPYHRFDVERLPASSTSQLSISSYVGWDQRRLDDILEDVDDRVAEEDFAAASARWADFEAGLLWHMRWEERILVPRLQRLSGEGSLAHCDEHRLIRAAARAVGEALGLADASAFGHAVEGLHDATHSHEFREEVVLYPRLDEVIGPVEALQLILDGLALDFRPARDDAGHDPA